MRSIWFGSPQWQIEALRRLEIPSAMQRAHGFAPLGAADGAVKRAIFAANVAKLQGPGAASPWRHTDALDQDRRAYRAAGFERTNRSYGYIRD